MHSIDCESVFKFQFAFFRSVYKSNENFSFMQKYRKMRTQVTQKIIIG